MSMFNDLLKRTFEFWIKKRWLKEIDRAVDRYNKAHDKATREHYIMNSLLEEYKKLYGEELRKNI